MKVNSSGSASVAERQAASETISNSRVEKKLFATALSQQLPLRLMLCRAPTWPSESSPAAAAGRDPTSLIINTNVAAGQVLAREYDGAVAQLKKTLEMDPSYEQTILGFVDVYTLQGKYGDALAELDRIRLLPSSVVAAYRARLHALAGRRAEALRLLHDLEERSRREYLPASGLGLAWMALGNKDRAFALFEKACSERDSLLRYLKLDPSFDPVRSDPRFQDLLKCVHLE